MSLRLLRWPYPFKWAFGITEDTDSSTLAAVRTVYEYCLGHGILPETPPEAVGFVADLVHRATRRTG